MGEKKQLDNSIDRMFFMVLILVPLMSIPWHEGIRLCDSTSYVLYAKKFATTGSLDYSSLFSMRAITWLPYAVYIFFFGVNGSISWVTTFEFCALLAVMYYSLRNYNQVIAFYSVALIAVSTFLIRESTEVMADMMLTLLVNVPILIYWRYIKNEAYPKPLLWGIIAGICWIAAFHAKESAIYYLVVCFCFSVMAWYKKLKDDVRFWLGFWGIFVLGILISGVWLYLVTGDPLHRIKMAHDAITMYATDSSETIWKTSEELTWNDLAYRLTLQPLTFFIKDSTMGLLLLLSLPFFAHFKKCADGFWGWYLVIPLVVWWIFPQRLDPYYPMRLTYRLWLPLMVPLAITAGHGIKMIVVRDDTRWSRGLFVAGGMILIGASLFFFARDGSTADRERLIFYSIVFGFITISMYVRENEILPDLRKVALIVVLLPFFYNHYNRFLWNDDNKSQYEGALEVKEILEKKNVHTVLVSSCLKEFYGLYDSKIQFRSYEDETKNDAMHDVYLVLDRAIVDFNVSEKASNRFSGREALLCQIETNPIELGFELIDDSGRYLVYHHR